MQIKQLLAAALIAAVVPAAFAATGYLDQSVPVNGKATGDFLGKINVATPVEVLEKKGAQALVRVSGWSLKEYPSQIFKAPGVRIEEASFDEEKAVKLDPKSGEKTVQGERLGSLLRPGLGAGKGNHDQHQCALGPGQGSPRRCLLDLPRGSCGESLHGEPVGDASPVARRQNRPHAQGRQRAHVPLAAGTRQKIERSLLS